MRKSHLPKGINQFFGGGNVYARKCQQQLFYIHIFYMSKEKNRLIYIVYPILASFSNYYMGNFTSEPKWSFYELPT